MTDRASAEGLPRLRGAIDRLVQDGYIDHDVYLADPTFRALVEKFAELIDHAEGDIDAPRTETSE